MAFRHRLKVRKKGRHAQKKYGMRKKGGIPQTGKAAVDHGAAVQLVRETVSKLDRLAFGFGRKLPYQVVMSN